MGTPDGDLDNEAFSRTRNFFSRYMLQKVHRLWAHPMVTWIMRLLASLGGLYKVPSYCIFLSSIFFWFFSSL